MALWSHKNANVWYGRSGKNYFWCSSGKRAKQQFCDDSYKSAFMTSVYHITVARKKRFLLLQAIGTFVAF